MTVNSLNIEAVTWYQQSSVNKFLSKLLHVQHVHLYPQLAQADLTNKYVLANAHQGQMINNVIMH